MDGVKVRKIIKQPGGLLSTCHLVREKELGKMMTTCNNRREEREY